VVVAASADSEPGPFLYGEKSAKQLRREAAELKRDPPLSDFATEVNPLADRTWKAVVPSPALSLPVDPKPVKPKKPYKDAIVIAHLTDPKPKKHKLRADTGVRAHVLEYVNEKRTEKAPETIRAHVQEYVSEKKKVKRDLVTANAHIDFDVSEKKKPRKRDLVVANAHITSDEQPKKRKHKLRNLVVAEAHITPEDAPKKRRHNRKPDLVVSEAHITVDDDEPKPRRHKRKADFVSPIAHITEEDSDKPKRRNQKPKPEIVSADTNPFPGEKEDQKNPGWWGKHVRNAERKRREWWNDA